MHPTAIILIFAFLLVTILAGTLVIKRSGFSLWRFLHAKIRDARGRITGVMYRGSAVLIGALLVVYGVRGIYRLIWVD